MMEFVSTEALQVSTGVVVTSQPEMTSCDDDVDNERSDNGTPYRNVGLRGCVASRPVIG